MSCYYPLSAYRSSELHEKTGNRKIVFSKEDVGDRAYEKLEFACGQCTGCRLDRSKAWAVRCVHEASLYKRNCFITLTFNDENLHWSGSLIKEDFQKFMKRLRRHHKGHEPVVRDGKKTYPIRYFHCGEYGEKLGRPHHHACLFNFCFEDLELWKVDPNTGVKLYTSRTLHERWEQRGHVTVGEVTMQSAAYVARYITKKVNGDRAEAHYTKYDPRTGEAWQIEPEYVTMSRRPGIGADWFKKYSEDVYPKDFVTHEGIKFQPPKYYDGLYEVDHEKELSVIKDKRRKHNVETKLDNIGMRRKAKRVCQESRFKRLPRGSVK